MRLSRKVVFALPSVLVGLGALIGYFCMGGDDEPAVVAPVAPDIAVQPVSPEVPPPQAEKPVEAPKAEPQPEVAKQEPLSEEERGPKTSAEYKELFARTGGDLSANELWRKIIVDPDALPVFVKCIEQLSNGNRPLALAELSCMPKPRRFEAIEKDGGWIISPETESRFASVVDALTSISVQQAAVLLNMVEPEFERIIHKDFGYPENVRFRAMMTDAITVILTTPVPDKPLQLVKVAPGLYKYAIPELEQLADAQKFMLRLGIANQAKINELAKGLWPWCTVRR